MTQLIGSSRISVIVGLGLTGLSVARHLYRQQCQFMVVDNRENPPALRAFQQEFPDVAVELGHFKLETLSGAHELIVSPGVSLQEPVIQAAVKHGVSIAGDIELFAREATAPIIAITGSNAKSTVTTLVGEMAEAAGLAVGVGGNIGTPALDLLHQRPDADLFVLELSSFQLETTQQLNAKVATILNISPDHMDRYPSMMAYMNAKLRVFFGAEKAVINRDDPLAQAPLAGGVNAIGFTTKKPDLVDFGLIDKAGEGVWLAKGLQPLMPVSQLSMRGAHNYINALSALALGEAAGIPVRPMLEVLQRFCGLPHRCEFIASVDGVDFINDSKATNLGAVEAALNGFHDTNAPKRIHLIAGGLAKGIDLSPLAPLLRQTVKAIYLMGADAHAIADQWRSVWASVGDQEDMPTITFVSDLTEAVEKSYDVATSQEIATQEIVLLSPACASQDMFKDYQERGEQFREAVLALSSMSEGE